MTREECCLYLLHLNGPIPMDYDIFEARDTYPEFFRARGLLAQQLKLEHIYDSRGGITKIPARGALSNCPIPTVRMFAEWCAATKALS